MSRFACHSCGLQAELRPESACPSCGAPAAEYRELPPLPAGLEEARDRARERLKGTCAVYPRCDGDRDRICQRENYGKPIGMGGAGLGRSFKANIEALDRHALAMSVVGPSFEPDTSFDFFGLRLSMPVMGASTSGIGSYNAGLDELEFCRAALRGCASAGSLSFRGDTHFYEAGPGHFALKALGEGGGRGVPIFKPRAQEDLRRLIALAEELGCPAVGVDLDGCGSTNFARSGKPVFRKTAAELRELCRSTRLPFVAKGIMSADEAEACVEAGAACVVVSNHGGRVLDSTPGTAEVLPGIASRVGSRAMVLADGGVRNGYDVLVMLALGAKGVLVGRDLIRAAIGGGDEGVRLQMERLREVLSRAMLMTGAASLAEVGPRLLAR